jgi:hypothetical protein
METEGVEVPQPAVEPATKPLASARRRLVRLEKEVAPKRPKKRRKKQPKAARVARTAKARQTLAAARPAKPTTVVLTMPHYVNDKVYGPGPTVVPADLLPGLLETEQRVRQNDANMFGPGRAAFIGPQNRVMPVHAAIFDSPMLNVLEALTI